jgi:hypothetical protein
LILPKRCGMAKRDPDYDPIVQIPSNEVGKRRSGRVTWMTGRPRLIQAVSAPAVAGTP